uniref:Uncharacterized protein n=1 Tax=Anguilla anguilla TaxID=7936 RepID=A0A0E9TS24_ANGAN
MTAKHIVCSRTTSYNIMI